MLDALDGDRGLWRNANRRSGLFGLPAIRERFYVRDQICTLLIRQRDPLRHVRGIESAGHSCEQVLIGWQRARRRGAALESSLREISRLRGNVRRILALTVASHAVATDTEPPVVLLTSVGMAD
jgi:hypothetical protein